MRAYGKDTEIIIDRESKRYHDSKFFCKQPFICFAYCPSRLPGWVVRFVGETRSHALLASYGLAPPLLARFHNGLLYKFIRGSVTTPLDLVTAPIYRGVARRLGQWHAVLPFNGAAGSVSKEHDSLPNRQAAGELESGTTKQVNGFHLVKPSQPSPNLWTIIQKWILALPANTDDERARRLMLQSELEWVVGELDDGQGIGGNSVCFSLIFCFHYFSACLNHLTLFSVGLCPLWPFKCQCHCYPSSYRDF